MNMNYYNNINEPDINYATPPITHIEISIFREYLTWIPQNDITPYCIFCVETKLSARLDKFFS